MHAQSPEPEAHDKSAWHFQIELEFENVGFWGEGKPGVPGEKPLEARKRTNTKLNPHMTPGPGIEPGTHWWEASALTTASSLLPRYNIRQKYKEGNFYQQENKYFAGNRFKFLLEGCLSWRTREPGNWKYFDKKQKTVEYLFCILKAWRKEFACLMLWLWIWLFLVNIISNLLGRICVCIRWSACAQQSNGTKEIGVKVIVSYWNNFGNILGCSLFTRD